MPVNLLTAAGITSFAGLLLLALFVLWPAANAWFTAQTADNQQAIIGLTILFVAAGYLALTCFGFITEIPCTVQSIGDYLLNVVLVAIVGNKVTQAGFTAVRILKDRRLQKIGNEKGLVFTREPGKLL